MNTIELKKMLYNFLITVNKNIYEKKTPSKISYPYIVYYLDLSETDDNQKMEIFDLYIDIFDNKEFDTTTIDALASSIDGDGAIHGATGLHRKHYFESGKLQCDIYRTNRDGDPPGQSTQDQNINQIRLEYQVMAYLV